MSDNAGNNVTFKVSNEALLKALKKALADDSSDSTDDLLCLIVSRLVDTVHVERLGDALGGGS